MWFEKKIDPKKIKAKNSVELISNGIKVIDHLPYLDYPNFRDSKEVAKRIMILMALFQLHVDAPLKTIRDWIISNDLEGFMTKEEKTFLQTNYNDLPTQDQTNIYWYVEALWSFAWSGKLHNVLTFKSPVEDSLATMYPNIAYNEPARPFIEKFELRDKVEIFTILDKFYRAHWFARNNELNGKVSDKVDIDIIMERRKSLEYICYAQIEWDQITLDT